MGKVSLLDAAMEKQVKEPRTDGLHNRFLKPVDFPVGEPVEYVFIKQYEDKMYGGPRFEVADQKGEEFHLPNSGSLKYQLLQGIEADVLSSGVRIEVIYNGMEFVKKYNRDIHKFEVNLVEEV